MYGDFLAQKKVQEGAWPSIMDMCYADAVISWNSIFGQRSQETHWSKFVSKITIPKNDKLKPFDRHVVIGYIETNEEEWTAFHTAMVNVRNTRIAHLNTNKDLHGLPNITWLLHSCFIYREWLIQALHLGNRLGYEIKITDQNTKEVIEGFKSQIANAYTGL